MDVNLAFIVGSAPSIDISVAYFRLESRRSPEFQRLGGLNIVVAVEKNRRLAGGFKRFGVNEGVKTCGDYFDGLEACCAQTLGNPFGSAVDIRFVFTFGADRRDPEKFVKLSKMPLAATFYKFSKVHIMPPGAMIMIRFQLMTDRK
jgi:hypothetical protein